METPVEEYFQRISLYYSFFPKSISQYAKLSSLSKDLKGAVPDKNVPRENEYEGRDYVRDTGEIYSIRRRRYRSYLDDRLILSGPRESVKPEPSRRSRLASKMEFPIDWAVRYNIPI